MSIISRLKVWIGSDTAELEKGLKRGKKKVSEFEKGVQKLGGIIAGAFAVNRIVSFTKECINLFGVQERESKKLEAVIKATGGAAELTAAQMGRYASELQDVTTYGDEATLSAMAIMSTFKSVKGDVFKEAIASAQDMATVMNQDLNQAVLQLGKALESPEVGLTALRRSGVSFSKEQIAQIKKLVAEGKKQEAQLIMLKELQNEFGGAAKAAAETAAGAAIQAENAWGDYKEAIGKHLTPSVEAISNITEAIKQNTAVVADEAIPTYKKWLGMIIPALSASNKSQAYANQLQKDSNEKAIVGLELKYQDINSLLGMQNTYRELNTTTNNYYKQTFDAISAELEKRNQGIAAIDKEKEKAAKLTEEKRKAEEAARQVVEDAITLSESSIEAINKKIAAYKQLAATADINDYKSQDFYKKEMLRLENLIAKTTRLQSARMLPQMKADEGGPISKPKQLYGVEDAAVDVSVGLTGFKEVDLLPKKLEGISKALEPVKADVMDFSDVASSSFGDMAVGFGEAIGQLASGAGNLQGFATLVAGTFADMAINVGKVAISTGVAVMGIKAALKSLNPYVAIAAGVALVALGTVVKSSLGRMSEGGGSSGGTFSSAALSGNGIMDTRTGSATESAAKPIEVVVRGQLKVKGSDLTAAIENEGQRKALTT